MFTLGRQLGLIAGKRLRVRPVCLLLPPPAGRPAQSPHASHCYAATAACNHRATCWQTRRSLQPSCRTTTSPARHVRTPSFAACRDHVLENKAIAASTAFMYAACLQHHVPEVRELLLG